MGNMCYTITWPEAFVTASIFVSGFAAIAAIMIAVIRSKKAP